MRHFILTDLEGVAGIDTFAHTRSSDDAVKAPAMDQLGREVNACIEGIDAADPDAEIDVWDGHGSGGLREQDVDGARYLSAGQPYHDLAGFDAMYFVGQHAMAGTAFAPLRHTYSSRSVDYYKLNGTFVGEFGCRAFVAGEQDVPTVLLAGDDKACHEAELFVPEIETVATKFGLGEESARHRPQEEAVEAVRAGAERATERLDSIPPLDEFEPPYELVQRFYDPIDDERVDAAGAERVDAYTMRIEADDVTGFEGRL